MESRDKEERTPLLLAASRSAWKTVGILISAGSRLDVVDGSQRNVLHLIVINGGLLTELSKNQAEVATSCAWLRGSVGQFSVFCMCSCRSS